MFFCSFLNSQFVRVYPYHDFESRKSKRGTDKYDVEQFLSAYFQQLSELRMDEAHILY